MIESGDGWFVADSDGLAQGPLTRSQLQMLRAEGKIGDEHLVWTLRQAEWVPLRRALGEKSAIEAARPPQPPRRKASSDPKPAQGAKKDHKKSTNRQGSAARPEMLLPGTSPLPPQGWNSATLQKAKPASATEQLLGTDKAAKLAQSQARAGEGFRRFFARWIDLAVLGGIGWALLSLIGFKTGVWWLGSPQAEWERSFVTVPLVLLLAALPLEVLLLGLSGYTPGRWLLNLRVVNRQGTPPGIAVAGNRAARVALAGQALLIFPFVVVAYAIAFGKLSSSGRTHWDQALDLSVRTRPLSSNRWWAVLAALVASWVMLTESVWMTLIYELLGTV